MVEPHLLCQLARQMESIIQQDPGNRGLQHWALQDDLWPAAQSLALASRVAITTGFYITGTNAIETDGPPGALILAQALHKLGIDVQLLVDSFSRPVLTAGLSALDISIPMADCTNLHWENLAGVTHLVAIERPGLSSDGRCYNHKGEDLSVYTAALDEVFATAEYAGVTTIGIGDGGNELGMGGIAGKVAIYLKQYNKPDYICCRTPAQYCLCAGVSNWAAYALTSLLSCCGGVNLLPQTSALIDLLEAIVAAGAVDGVTKKQAPTVDGLPQTWELNVYSSLRRLTLQALRRLEIKHA